MRLRPRQGTPTTTGTQPQGHTKTLMLCRRRILPTIFLDQFPQLLLIDRIILINNHRIHNPKLRRPILLHIDPPIQVRRRLDRAEPVSRVERARRSPFDTMIQEIEFGGRGGGCSFGRRCCCGLCAWRKGTVVGVAGGGEDVGGKFFV